MAAKPAEAEFRAVHVTDSADSAPVKKDFSYNICGACKKFFLNPYTNWKSGLFLFFGVLGIICVFLSFGGFLASVAVCVVMSVFAIFDFRDIFYLMEQVEVYDQLNSRFEEENEKFKESNELLVTETAKFSDVTDRFRADIASLENNINVIEKFVEERSEEDANASDDKKNNAINLAKEWIKNWRQEVDDNVRRVIQSAAEAINRDNLDEKQYKKFIDSLPTDYRQRIEKKYPTFDDVDSQLNRDGSIDFIEFSDLMDSVCLQCH